MNKLLEIQCGKFTSALKQIQSAIAPKSTLHILEHVLINTGTICTVSATDHELTITSSFVPASLHDENVFLLPFRQLLAIVSTFKNDDKLTIYQHHAPFRYILECNGSKMLMIGLNPEDYPTLPNAQGFETITTLEFSEDQSNTLKKSTSYCSTESSRVSLTGVAIRYNENKASIYASNGYSLLRIKTSYFLPNEQCFVIPGRAIDAIAGKTAQIAIIGNNSAEMAHITSGEQTIFCRLIEEKFPSVENVIPIDNQKTAVFKRKELLAAVHLAAMFTPSVSPQIVLQFTQKGVSVFADNIETGIAAEITVECKQDFVTEGDSDFVIAFNYKYLTAVLETFPDVIITLAFSTPTRAALFSGEKLPDIMALLMPMRTDKSSAISLDTYAPPKVAQQPTLSSKDVVPAEEAADSTSEAAVPMRETEEEEPWEETEEDVPSEETEEDVPSEETEDVPSEETEEDVPSEETEEDVYEDAELEEELA